MQNAYSLRLKEASMNERVRELTEKANAEAEAERARYAGLAAEREAQRAALEEQAREAAERQQVRGVPCLSPSTADILSTGHAWMLGRCHAEC